MSSYEGWPMAMGEFLISGSFVIVLQFYMIISMQLLWSHIKHRPLHDNDIDWLKVGKYGMDYETILSPAIANKQEGQSSIIEQETIPAVNWS